jgi:hypothetical protein
MKRFTNKYHYICSGEQTDPGERRVYGEHKFQEGVGITPNPVHNPSVKQRGFLFVQNNNISVFFNSLQKNRYFSIFVIL